jgi:hypothetical protein
MTYLLAPCFDLLATRARTNGWAVWSELCEAAGLEPHSLYLTEYSRPHADLYDALLRSGVRVHHPGPDEATRFRAPV